ncbi:MAG: Gldg family protein, partial [Ruminococcus sp.]|nr:Gldg family protein [Ruminococcus sp.]
MAENKEKSSATAEQTPKKSGLKRLFQSRKMRHGSLAVVFTAIAVAVVILLNVVAGLLVDRFPEMKADFTANKAFALANDTKEYMSRLDKDVKLYIISDEDDFMNTSTYFVQAKNLLDKMVSSSNGKFTYEFVNTTDNPKFTQQYPNINWQTKDTVGVLTCGKQYKGLSVKDCFTYDEDYYNYYGSYSWTGTTIEQAVVKGTLDVTTEEKVVVDILTGEGETDTNGYEGLKALLSDNAFQVNEVSLLTGEP